MQRFEVTVTCVISQQGVCLEVVATDVVATGNALPFNRAPGPGQRREPGRGQVGGVLFPSSTTVICRFVSQAYTSAGEISRFNKFTRGNVMSEQPHNVIDILTKDQREVEEMLQELESLRGATGKPSGAAARTLPSKSPSS